MSEGLLDALAKAVAGFEAANEGGRAGRRNCARPAAPYAGQGAAHRRPLAHLPDADISRTWSRDGLHGTTGSKATSWSWHGYPEPPAHPTGSATGRTAGRSSWRDSSSARRR